MPSPSELPLFSQALHDHEKPSSSRRLSLILILCLVALVSLSQINANGATDGNGSPARHLYTLLSRSEDSADKLSSGIRKPPQAPIQFTATPESIAKAVKDLAAEERQLVDLIVKNVKPETASFQNTLLPYLYHEANIALTLAPGQIYPYVSADQALINASQSAGDVLGPVIEQTYANKGFQKLVDAVYQKDGNNTKLPLEIQRVIEQFPYSFEFAGIDLPENKQKRLKNITFRLQDLSQEFSQAVITDNPSIWFTPEELKGTQPDILASLPKGKDKNAGKLEVKLQNPSLGSITSHCTNADTRQKIYIAQANLAPENVGRLEEAVELREELANILGFPNYATYRIRSNMAGTPKAVNDLLSDVATKLGPAAAKSIAHLKELKKKDVGKADHLWAWDTGYYYRKSNEEEYSLDTEKIKEWFPADHTLEAVLNLYSNLFGLDFIKIEGKDRDQMSKSGNGSELVWHPDVELYAVWDKPAEGGGFIGYLYLDVYYREGKKGGAFEFPIVPGFTEPNGKRYYPSCALVCNFKKTDSGTPSLLYRSDVQTLLHEAGHGMYHLTSMTRFSRFHGPGGCPIDYVEAPSQMMENFAYTPVVLKKLSKHWSYLSPEFDQAYRKANNDTKVKPPEMFPDKLISDLLRNKNAYSGYNNMYQVYYASFDMALHEPSSAKAAKDLDTTVLWNSKYREFIKGVDTPAAMGRPKWGHGQSTFTYSMGGYEAGYYAYLWSKSYAEDVFYTAFKQDPFSSKTGIRWRRTALQPGGAKDYDTMLKDFLGREPNRKAFFEDLGVKT